MNIKLLQKEISVNSLLTVALNANFANLVLQVLRIRLSNREHVPLKLLHYKKLKTFKVLTLNSSYLLSGQ